MPGFIPGIHEFFAIRHEMMTETPHAKTAFRGFCAASTSSSSIGSGRMRKEGLTFANAEVISTRPARPGFWRSNWNWKMTGSTRSSGGLDDRRKRLLFRCWHRGTREMDLILGRFADAEIAGLTDDELGQLEQLIDVSDPDLYAALTGNAPLAPEYASPLFERIKAFRPADHDA
jgi:antitoxin CptB